MKTAKIVPPSAEYDPKTVLAHRNRITTATIRVIFVATSPFGGKKFEVILLL